MIQDYTFSFFGAETEIGSQVQARQPFMNIIGLQGSPDDSQNITGCLGSGNGAIPKGTDLFKVEYFSFGVGECTNYSNERNLLTNLKQVNENYLFDPKATGPSDVEDLYKHRNSSLPTNNFSVVKFADSHSPNLAKACMEGKLFKAAQIYFVQQPTPKSKKGFISNRFVFLDLAIVNIEHSLSAIGGTTSGEPNMPRGYSHKGNIIAGADSGHESKSVCEVIHFVAKHTWIYTYFYNSTGSITNICKGR